MGNENSGKPTEQEQKETQQVDTSLREKESIVESLEPVLPKTEEPAGEPTPSKKEEAAEGVDQEEKPSLSKSETQKRIDRMYARLQKEREARMKAENVSKAQKYITQTEDEDDDEEESSKSIPKGLTEEDVRRILSQQAKEKEFISVESEVLMRHPSAIKEDGSFNMEDPFAAKYIEIGKRNPILATMIDGPKLAEAQAEKELGILYKQGRLDEASNAQEAHNAHTLSSTSKPPAKNKVSLSDAQKKMAARYNMTETEYLESLNKRTVF